ncbi:ankyrin repeat domain-containing protein [Legionella lytica]|uniref:Ankyrin repeat domain-containing protein n=1 Tax=Legionella lytica TaxID=96232 RepID=A0ABW8DB32_9GAMM
MFSLDKENPIFKLAIEGNLIELQSKINAQPQLLHVKASNGSNLLMFAAQMGHIEIVQWLQQQGISLAEKGMLGNTALLFAAGSGSTKAVQWLLENGASLEEQNNDGYNALWMAAYNGHSNTVKYLLSVGAAPLEQRQLWLYTTKNAGASIIRFLFDQVRNGQGKTLSLDTLSQQIVTPSGIALILPYLAPEQITLFIHTMRENASELIEKMTTSHFRKIWDIITIEQKKAIIDAMGKQALQMLPSLKTNHFMAVVDLLTTEQKSELRNAELHREAIISELRNSGLAQPKGLKEGKDEVAKTGKSILHSATNGILILTYQEQSKTKQGSLMGLMIKEPLNYETFEKTLNQLHRLGVNLFNAIHSAKTAAEFGVILRDYTPEQMTQIPQEINRLAELINTLDDLRRVLRNLNPKQINIFYTLLREPISKVTGSIEKYCDLLARLETEQIGALIESSIEHLSALINTAADYNKICGYLTNQQEAWLASTLQHSKSRSKGHDVDPELLLVMGRSIAQDGRQHSPVVNTHNFFSLPQELSSPVTDEHSPTDTTGRKRSSSH